MSIQFKILDLFKTFLKEKNEESNTQTYDVNSPTSIYKYRDEFEEFVSVELEDDFSEQIQAGFSLDNLQKDMSDKSRKAASDDNNSPKVNSKDDVSNLSADDKNFQAFDLNQEIEPLDKEY